MEWNGKWATPVVSLPAPTLWKNSPPESTRSNARTNSAPHCALGFGVEQENVSLLLKRLHQYPTNNSPRRSSKRSILSSLPFMVSNAFQFEGPGVHSSQSSAMDDPYHKLVWSRQKDGFACMALSDSIVTLEICVLALEMQHSSSIHEPVQVLFQAGGYEFAPDSWVQADSDLA